MPLPKRPQVNAPQPIVDQEELELDRALGLVDGPPEASMQKLTPASAEDSSLALPELDFDFEQPPQLSEDPEIPHEATEETPLDNTSLHSSSELSQESEGEATSSEGDFLEELGIDPAIFGEDTEAEIPPEIEPHSNDDWDALLLGDEHSQIEEDDPELALPAIGEDDEESHDSLTEETSSEPVEYNSWAMPPDDAFEDIPQGEFEDPEEELLETEEALESEEGLSDEPLEEDANAEEPSEAQAKKSAKPKKGKKKLSKLSPLAVIFTPIKKAYSFIVRGIFGGLKGLLRVLSHLPLVGGVFRLALQSVRVLEWIARGAPALVVAAAIFALNYFATPHSALIELPDSASASFESFSYDETTGEAVGVVSNKGETVLYLSGAMTVWSMQPSLNPLTWVQPQVTNECAAPAIEVEAGETGELRVACEVKNGFAPRVSGELVEE